MGDGAQHRRNAQRLRPGQPGDRIGPRSGGVYEHPGGQFQPALGCQPPAIALALGGHHAGAGLQHRSAALRLRQINLVHRGDVDVGTGGFVDRAGPGWSQAGDQRSQFGPAQAADIDPGGGEFVHERIERFGVLLASDVQAAARAEQAVLGQVRPRCDGERHDVWPAIAFVPERR